MARKRKDSGGPAVAKRAQIGMDDRIIENPELLALLEEREQLKDGARAYRVKDKEAKEAIGKISEQPPYRIGRFLITRQEREGRTVEFEVQPSSSIKITTVA